ncbi:MAG TPA: hypothetical protein VG371_17455 [Solirubrobacteraceae bacterium]|jgi:hypothetical protein|nr:hypothetical protein [Solirubrobacteraceae bacterium]
MAISASNVQQFQEFSGGMKLITTSLILDGSYPTGGSPGLARLLGLQTIVGISFSVTTGLILDYDTALDKVQVFYPGGAGAGTKASEVPAGTNLNTTWVKLMAFGYSG